MLSIAKDQNTPISESSTILDFGCGYGQATAALIEIGFPRTFGADTDPDLIELARSTASSSDREHFCNIHPNPYQIPFDDNFFDFVFSNQVFEHVRDLDVAFHELHRVMRPNALGIHIFPPKFRILETHTFVPFGNIVMSHLWHRLWANLGFRKRSRGAGSASECAAANLQFIREYTVYRTEKEILRIASEQGFSANFIHSLPYSKAFRLPRNLRTSWLLNKLYGLFISKVLIIVKNFPDSQSALKG